ncbi:hypothetical protein GCM10009801_04460 [Streptomyces albiaxialis]|uniref:Uncharacterized protein n=1 Tax=Streptomyces albiaxialis TaxID=329523 RepID=A0ABP5H7C2_9ACTN
MPNLTVGVRGRLADQSGQKREEARDLDPRPVLFSRGEQDSHLLAVGRLRPREIVVPHRLAQSRQSRLVHAREGHAAQNLGFAQAEGLPDICRHGRAECPMSWHEENQTVSSNSQGKWRLQRIPGKRVGEEPDGTYTIPLWVARDGAHFADLTLRLAGHEAEQLHAELCLALGDGTPGSRPA